MQNLTGCLPLQPTLGNLALAGGWTRLSPKVSSNPYDSVILKLYFFSKTKIMAVQIFFSFQRNHTPFYFCIVTAGGFINIESDNILSLTFTAP